jgi:hypothetical protein
MKKRISRALSSLIPLFLLAGCSQGVSPVATDSKQKSEFQWTKESLIRMQIDPATLKELDFIGGGGWARVLDSAEPELVSSFATEVLPKACMPLSALLNGSSTLGDNLILQTENKTSPLYGNAFYQYVRTFPSEAAASDIMKNVLKIADKCGLYTRIKASGESDEWYLWDRVVESNSNSFIAQGDASTYAVGQVGSATYFYWAIYASSTGISQEAKVANVSRLKQMIETLLKKEQGL